MTIVRRLARLTAGVWLALAVGVWAVGPPSARAGGAGAAPRETAAQGAPPCDPSGGAGGLPPGLHELVVNGRPAKLLVGQRYRPERPAYLAFYLHGDEGGYDFPTRPSSAVRSLIDERGWILVAPQAPPVLEDGQTYYPWYGDGGEASQGSNAALLTAALDHILATYNVCRSALLGAAASGGAFFYDTYFFPLHAGQRPAFTILHCGAGGFDQRWGGRYESAAALGQGAAAERSELRYTIGTEDFLYDNAPVSAATYRALGFSVSTDYLHGTGHCGYDLFAKTSDYWRAKADALGPPAQHLRTYLPLLGKQ